MFEFHNETNSCVLLNFISLSSSITKSACCQNSTKILRLEVVKSNICLKFTNIGLSWIEIEGICMIHAWNAMTD